MVDCRRAVDLLHELLEDEVCPDTHQTLMQHFANCPPCQALFDTYKTTTNLCRKTLRRTAPKELGERLTQLLRTQWSSRMGCEEDRD
jgi:anti-sigma factor (TIGR02949 family)